MRGVLRWKRKMAFYIVSCLCLWYFVTVTNYKTIG